MNDYFWNMKNDFLIAELRKIVKDTFEDDKKNYQKMEKELSTEVNLLDDSLTLYNFPSRRLS